MRNKRKEEKEKQIQSTRRLLLIGSGQLLLGAVLVGRLYQLQVAQTAQFQKLSDDNQFNARMIEAPRGRIFDYRGRLLAGNADVFEMNVVPAHVQDLRRLLDKVSQVIPLKKQEIERVVSQAESQPNFLQIPIRTGLTQRELSQLSIRSAVLDGIQFDRRYRRIYPQGSLAAHLTGYVSPVTRKEVDRDRRLRRLPNLRTGKIGLEYANEQMLRGKFGVEQVEMNARGKPVRIVDDVLPESGEDLHLSVDMEVQNFVARRLQQGRAELVKTEDPDVQRALMKDKHLLAHLGNGENLILKDEKGRYIPPESGAAILMDVQTGDIRAMVSQPGYDPNLFTDRLSVKDWERLNAHPRNPLLNRVISGLYSPGSTFKMVVLAAALEAGIVSSSSKYFCSGFMEFGDRNFYCWNKDGHGSMDGRLALERSCDVYFYEVALKTGIDRIHNMAQRLGLGILSNLDIPGEKVGIMPNRAWKQAARGVPWTPGETAIAGIGQGFVLTTPLQLAVMTARLANGKEAVEPRILKTEGETPKFAPLDVSPSIIRELQRGMRSVTNGSLGTARRYDLPGIGMSGKTGTVQVKRITEAQREAGITDNIDRPWKERDHALFVGYAPVKNPKFAAAVVVEHGGSGSSMAAPIARDILDFALQREFI